MLEYLPVYFFCDKIYLLLFNNNKKMSKSTTNIYREYYTQTSINFDKILIFLSFLTLWFIFSQTSNFLFTSLQTIGFSLLIISIVFIFLTIVLILLSYFFTTEIVDITHLMSKTKSEKVYKKNEKLLKKYSDGLFLLRKVYFWWFFLWLTSLSLFYMLNLYIYVR